MLAALDPDLDSVLNVNTPADYEAARARPAPEVTVQLFGTLAERRGQPTRPATSSARPPWARPPTPRACRSTGTSPRR